MTSDLRVLIADGNEATRSGTTGWLREHGFTVCAEASDGPGAVDAALDTHPDLSLIDGQLPGDGIAAAAEIAKHLPSVGILILTVSPGAAELFRALQAGVVGYLPKDTDPARLPVVLRQVAAGESAIPRFLVTRLVDEFRARGKRRAFSRAGMRNVVLTRREWEILELMREGASTTDMANALLVSPVTVRRHVSAVLHKLGARDRESAIRLAAEQGERQAG
jgi:DNA-binding NarL/FixJ family response regulator